MAGLNTGTSIVRWIDGHSFFGRPRYDRRQVNCQQAERLSDYATRLTSCRFKAANNCATPDIGIFWTGDSCVCSTLWGYATKFSSCWADTPYSACYNANNNNVLYSSWSTGHCTTTKPGTSTSTLKSVLAPSSTSIVRGPTVTITIAPPPQPSVSSKEELKPAPSSQRQDPKPSDPPRATSTPSRSIIDPKPSAFANPSPTNAPVPSSEAQKPKTEKSDAIAPTSVPEPSFVTISVAPRTTAQSSGGLSSTTPPHAPLAKWTGTGALLQGYCATPYYTMIDGPTAYWVPVVGCMPDKPDCCPFDIPPSTIAVEAVAAETGLVSGGGGIAGAAPTSRGFPSALSPAQATLSKCPDDYHSIGDGCCPSNYFPWSTTFGGQVPCYSTLRAAMTPPPVSADMAADPSTPTSAIVNVVYAMQYPLKAEPPRKSGLSTGAKIGIGAGAGVAAIVFGVLIFLLAWKHKQHKRDKKALEEMSGIGSTRQSVAASSAFGGVKDWRKTVSSEVSSGLETVQEPTLPQVGEPNQNYSAGWRPGQHRAVAPAVPHPGYYSTGPTPDMCSEMDSDNRYGNRSELHSGNFGMQTQELQGGYGQWHHEGVAQQVRYYEAPAGRMTPMPPSPAPGTFYHA